MGQTQVKCPVHIGSNPHIYANTVYPKTNIIRLFRPLTPNFSQQNTSNLIYPKKKKKRMNKDQPNP